MKLPVLAAAAVLVVLASACGDPDDDGADVCADPPCATATAERTATPSDTPVATATAIPPQATPSAAPPTRTPAPSSGTGVLEGYVHIGPTCPVVREGEDCDDKPHEADLDVVDGAGTVVLAVRSGADGRFSATLDPGAYRLVPRLTGTLPYAGEQSFTIEEGKTTSLDVAYDSGIR